MIKRLMITWGILIGCSIALQAQTLKISDVKSNDDRMYKDASEHALGKNLILEIYDSNVKIFITGDKKPTILREVSNHHYSGVTEESNSEVWNADLTIDTTVGIVTSAVLTIRVSEKNNGIMGRSASCTITAKRF